MSNRGIVYLVGAGPGDPGLLTLRGAECLAKADVVLYDYLASPQLLRHAPAWAELVCLGRHGSRRHGGGRLMSQDEVNALLVGHASDGKTVVRLKGGDPGVFGRLAEEAAALTIAGIAFEVVPGITTATAAGTYAGITVTDREHASCVAFVTGREQAGKERGDSLDYAALARFPGTLVFYMGVTTAPEWSQALMAGGKPRDTPVAIVRHCSLASQQTWICRLDEVAERLAPRAVRPPVVVIVGQVAQQPSLTEWFANRPLFGQSVLVTRPEHQADTMGHQLVELGAELLTQPAIAIAPPADWAAVDRTIERICTEGPAEFDWLVFSSRNGVEYFLNRLRELGHDWRVLAGVRLAAIGRATSEALAERDLVVDCQPAEYRAEALAAELAPRAAGQGFLLLRASRGREVLADSLQAAGGRVEQVVVYESRDVAVANADIADRLAEGTIDWVTVTSSAIARSLAQVFGKSLATAKLAAISPLTGEVLTELGYPPATVATEYTSEGVVAAILAASGKG
ncbi:uroporphyrinogen-III C-methyltransferase [Rubripirellula amarantea]|nr:uroporphyrinogen-III C-methyltransferase [Rubripirellula amarantea]